MQFSDTFKDSSLLMDKTRTPWTVVRAPYHTAPAHLLHPLLLDGPPPMLPHPCAAGLLSYLGSQRVSE